jgi:8-oxo-(d)GTP phosphatase
VVSSHASPRASRLRAAGGVVHRGGTANPEVAIAYRPRYDDWSLPKGKLHDGEPPVLAAVREIAEEIGSHVAVTRRLLRVRYPVAGVPKTVDYWAMRYLDGEFEASEEVSKIEWVTVDKARHRLSYPHDREVLDAFSASGPTDAVIALVRHARAGKSSAWHADDTLRPLDPSGRGQARLLAPFLEAFAPQRIIAADRVRCVQTVEPLAARLTLPITEDARFDDEGYARHPGATRRLLDDLIARQPSTAVCSQGETIPGLIAHLALSKRVGSTTTRKAGTWIVSFATGMPIAADYYRTPSAPK